MTINSTGIENAAVRPVRLRPAERLAIHQENMQTKKDGDKKLIAGLVCLGAAAIGSIYLAKSGKGAQVADMVKTQLGKAKNILPKKTPQA